MHRAIRSLTFASSDGGEVRRLRAGQPPGGRVRGATPTPTASPATGWRRRRTPSRSCGCQTVAAARGGCTTRSGRGDTVSARLPRSAFAPVSRRPPPPARRRRHRGHPDPVARPRGPRVGPEAQVLYALPRGPRRARREVRALADGSARAAPPAGALRRAPGDGAGRAAARHPPLRLRPAPIIELVLARPPTLGWPASRVHLERFGADALDPGDPFTVAARRRAGAPSTPGGTVCSRPWRAAGVDVPNMCRQGVCGECRMPVSAARPRTATCTSPTTRRRGGRRVMAASPARAARPWRWPCDLTRGPASRRSAGFPFPFVDGPYRYSTNVEPAGRR